MRHHRAVLVHRYVELSAAKLKQLEGILHGDIAASCSEGLSLTAEVRMEGSRPSESVQSPRILVLI